MWAALWNISYFSSLRSSTLSVLRWFKVYFIFAPRFTPSQLHNLFHKVWMQWPNSVNALGRGGTTVTAKKLQIFPPALVFWFFFQSKAQSSLLLGESNCFQSSLIKHVTKANLVSLFQTPANGLIINLVPFLIANLVSQGLHKGDIRGQAGAQSVFQQSWSKGVSLVPHLIMFYPEFLKQLWFPRAGQM